MFRLEDLCATGLAPVELISCSLARSTGLAPDQHSTLLMGQNTFFVFVLWALHFKDMQNTASSRTCQCPVVAPLVC